MQKLKRLLYLFWTMFKIGLFTFGGGYGMLALIEREIVEKKKWLDKDEFLNLIGIAESTPGPIAVNSATYIGQKREGFSGAFFATLGVVLPSFIIIFAISFFFDKFLELKYVGYAFNGIRVGVCFLIIVAGVKLFAKTKKTVFNVILFSVTVILMGVLTLFSRNFSTIYYILGGGTIGVIVYLITFIISKRNKKTENLNKNIKGDKQL